MRKLSKVVIAAAVVAGFGGNALAFEPSRPVEFIVTAGPGGGTDIFARTIQSIIGKYKLMPVSAIVTNMGGAAGAEGFAYTAAAKGDDYKLAFGTNNAYLLPVRAKVPYKIDDLTPVASLAADEFILWVNGKASFKTAADYVAKAKATPLKMGGSQSKDVDQVLTSMISEKAGIKLTYIPFKSGGEASVQLSGGHIDSNVNNPSESVGQWQAGLVKPLCVFKTEKLTSDTVIANGEKWSDIPTCKSTGIDVANYDMPRTVWLPAGVKKDVVDYYADVFKKVVATPEWKKYLADSSQSEDYMDSEQLTKFVAEDTTAVGAILKREGWLAK
ncbi:Bug family tripartite tricarboxylate transporter substrate binding protein [Rhizobium leucaenae]|uniref:Bug family tripartite tricarboxylate transporter substrate binding protein n=1 Tax=Rhizobium leucaenae TaxID=29450 RepID=UPI0007EE3E9D|nr:tripartite tricarboxylate transporter substrate binding protein [Rhizobium leucaenae]MBB6305206.1 tripartite-type tricarboxylate transporter receptor subunit TctC [Rhizobium leucaenae]